MASEEVKGENSQPLTLNYKTWVLRVSVHCEGCKRKVKKIISQVPGVHTVDIDIRQQRAIVIGNVEADTLINKLLKSGKNAELWPEQPMQKEKKLPGKSKPKEKQPQQQHQESQVKNQEVIKVKMHKPSGEKKEANPPPVKIEALKQPPPKKSEEKIDDFDVNVRQKSKENNDGGSNAAIKAVESNSKDSPGDHQEKDQSQSEGKKVEGCPVTSQPLAKATKSGGAGDHNCEGEVGVGDHGGGGGGTGSGSGKNVKKKRNKGQNGKSMSKAGGATPSSSCANKPANMESGNDHNGGPPNSLMPANESPPRQYSHHNYPPHGPHHYGHLPSPSYGVSYNTSYPTSSHTTSYYAPFPPANAYAYSHPGPESHPPPPPPMSNPDSYPSQPLDSFEMFSDENPNGCLVM